jgi:hypothetical protein
MLRWITRVSCFCALMLAASFAVAQAEFSAEIVDLQKSGTPTQAKIYFAKDKMRIEAQTASAHGSAVIINYATQTGDVVMAQQHMYMEMPLQAQSQRMGYASAFFQAGDVENACGDWQRMGHEGSSCHKVGSESQRTQHGEIRDHERQRRCQPLLARPQAAVSSQVGRQVEQRRVAQHSRRCAASESV